LGHILAWHYDRRVWLFGYSRTEVWFSASVFYWSGTDFRFSGLIPQAPFHTASLCVTRKQTDEDEGHKGKVRTVVDHVVEQRISNLAQGILTLGTMTGPLLTVLQHVPQAVGYSGGTITDCVLT